MKTTTKPARSKKPRPAAPPLTYLGSLGRSAAGGELFRMVRRDGLEITVSVPAR